MDDEADGVAVRPRSCELGPADLAARPDLVDDNDGLAEGLFGNGSDDTRADIGAATSRRHHDQIERSVWISLRSGRFRDECNSGRYPQAKRWRRLIIFERLPFLFFGKRRPAGDARQGQARLRPWLHGDVQ